MPLQFLIGFLNVLLILYFGWRIRKQSDLSFITLFPWMLLIVYGFMAYSFLAYGVTAFGIVLVSRFVYKRHIQPPSVITMVLSYVLIVGIEFFLWGQLNYAGLGFGMGDAHIFYLAALGVLGGLLFGFRRIAPKSKKRDHIQSYSLATFTQELIVSLSLFALIAAPLWGSLWTTPLFYLPPLVIPGVIVTLYLHRKSRHHPDKHLPTDDALFNDSVTTFLLFVLAVFVPIIGPLLAMVLHSHFHRDQKSVTEGEMSQDDDTELQHNALYTSENAASEREYDSNPLRHAKPQHSTH